MTKIDNLRRKKDELINEDHFKKCWLTQFKHDWKMNINSKSIFVLKHWAQACCFDCPVGRKRKVRNEKLTPYTVHSNRGPMQS